MPNPLSQVIPAREGRVTIRAMDFTALAPQKNPDMAARVLMALSAWAKLDTEMGVVFASFLGTQAHIGVAIYNQLTNLNTQDSTLRAAAKLVLDKDQMDLFLALLKISRGPRDQRNEMAHGVWGFSTDLPDALLLLSPKITLTLRGEVVAASEALKMHATHKIPLPAETIMKRIQARGDIADNVWVYRQPDIDEIHRQIIEAADLWADFGRFMWAEQGFLQEKGKEIAEAARGRLFGHTAIRATIDRARAERGEPPLPPL